MKILVVTSLYPPHALGGYELSCQDVVRRWRSNGHEVVVLTTSTRLPGVANVTVEPDIYRDLAWYWADHELRRPPPLKRWLMERANDKRLDELLDTMRPDVVSLWAMGGMSMSLVSRCVERGQPMVAVVEDDWLTYGPNVDAWTAAWSRRPRWIGQVAARLSGVPTAPPSLPPSVTVAFASDYLRDRAATTGAVGFTTAEIIPLGIDATDFPLQPVKPRPWRGRLLCVGRIEARKGFDVAVRALAELPDVTLRLVGPSNGHLADLMSLARELGVAERVSSEVVRREQLASTYADSDAVLFLSRWDEPFGLVPLEAMSQATPVIATRRGGSAEFLVDGVNCLEVGIDDPGAVAQAVRRLAENLSLRERLSGGGAETAVRFDVRDFADRLEALHAQAAKATTSPVVAAVESTVKSPGYDGPAPEVSVVVSTHGRAGLLSGLLDTLERQSGIDAEVVIADNGSGDETRELLAARTPVTSLRLLAIRVAYHDGPGVPRNTAASLARAPLLAFTDDDCLPTSDWLRELVSGFDTPTVTIVQGRTEPEPATWQGPWSRSLNVTSPSGLFETANLACRRDGFIEVGGFSPRRMLTGRAFAEDAQLGAALARRGEARFRSSALVHHRVMPGTYRDLLVERTRLAGFPDLVNQVPELRRGLIGGLFLNQRTLATDTAVAAAATAVLRRRSGPLLAAAPWAMLCWRGAAGRPGKPRAVRATQIAAADLVGLAALVRGSLRARRTVL